MALQAIPALALIARMADASATRARKIAALREAIAAGTYSIPAAKIAAQMKSPER